MSGGAADSPRHDVAERRARLAYRISYASAAAVLLFDFCAFALSDTFAFRRRISQSAEGVSVAADLVLFVFFLFAVPQWGLLWLKAWVSAGAAAYCAYAFPYIARECLTFAVAAFFLGACSLRKGVAASAAVGFAALAAAAVHFFNF